MIYFKDVLGNEHRVEIIGTNLKKGKCTIFLDRDMHPKTLKVYYRNEKTWDDHMGNTQCGYYINVPYYLYHHPQGFKNHTKRIYINHKGWQ